MWKPMTELPHDPDELAIAATHKDDPTDRDIYLCRCSKGEFYPIDQFLSLDEMGLVPMAWADVPEAWKNL